MGGGRAADALERDEPAAVVVDDSDQRDPEDPQHPHRGEIEAPELPWPRDANPSWPGARLVFEGDHEIASPGQDAPEGFLAGPEAKDSRGEVPKLTLAELRVFNMEADDRFLYSRAFDSRRAVQRVRTPPSRVGA